VELLSELEGKIDRVLSSVKSAKEEKERIERELGEKIKELETENQSLKDDVGSLRKSIEEKQNKLDSVAGKVQGLLLKLESAA
jgi:seryl-tRNA synthetase